MRAPLAVRIRDFYTERQVTKYVSGLTFTKTAPGGHQQASCRLSLPQTVFPDLGPADRMWIYDARSGDTLWEGYTNNPGTQSGTGGDGFELSALGGMSLASDRADRLIYLDTALDKWRRDDYAAMAPSANTDIGALPDTGTQALVLQFNPGQPITGTSTAKMVYDAFLGSPMTLGGYQMTNRCGSTDATFESQWYAGTSLADSRAFSTSGLTIAKFAITHYPAGATRLTVRIARVSGGATNIATDDVWGGFANVKVLGQRVDRYGTALTMTVATTVLASEVVEDMLGRVLTMCDPATSTVDATTFGIDQLSYYDGVKAAGLLDDLTLYEPDMLWEILESNTAGLHRFNYRAWPTTPRYVIGPREDVEVPGSDVDLCNRITVNWTDKTGKPQITVRTTTVDALGSRIRDADPVTLPDGRGSQANAERIGDQILATKAAPPAAARVTVTRPIVDMVSGGLVYPWEIQPGYLARIQETGEDLRVTEMTYSDDSCTAELTLGDPVLTLEQRLIRLAKVAPKSTTT